MRIIVVPTTEVSYKRLTAVMLTILSIYIKCSINISYYYFSKFATPIHILSIHLYMLCKPSVTTHALWFEQLPKDFNVKILYITIETNILIKNNIGYYYRNYSYSLPFIGRDN